MYSSDSFLLHWYLEKFWKPKKNTLEDFLFQYSKDIADFSVLQIGANDGLVNDPICKLIRKEKWTGVLLEPQELVYNKYLVPLYKNYGIYIHNHRNRYIWGKKKIYEKDYFA
jgi:hypothetical protein